MQMKHFPCCIWMKFCHLCHILVESTQKTWLSGYLTLAFDVFLSGKIFHQGIKLYITIINSTRACCNTPTHKALITIIKWWKNRCVCCIQQFLPPVFVCRNGHFLVRLFFFFRSFFLSFYPLEYRLLAPVLICLSSVNTKDQPVCFVSPKCKSPTQCSTRRLCLSSPVSISIRFNENVMALLMLEDVCHQGRGNGTDNDFWHFFVFRICKWFTCLHLSWWWWWWYFLHFVLSLILWLGGPCPCSCLTPTLGLRKKNKKPSS